VLDEFFLLLGGQDGVDKCLLLEEDKPVEAGEEDDTQEDIGLYSYLDSIIPPCIFVSRLITRLVSPSL